MKQLSILLILHVTFSFVHMKSGIFLKYIDTTFLPGVDKSPCHVTSTEQNVIVDCANKNLGHLKPEWFPINTTILYLEGNLLDSIPEGIFENCSKLQTLNLNNNKIKTIMPRAFLGLHQLENLDLGINQLDICDQRFPFSNFENLHNLKVLDLLQNVPFDKDQYCYGFIGNIVSLTSLSIDTRGKHVYFGEEFQNLTKLEKLIITGDAEIITDDSFRYVSNLKYLDLHYMLNIIKISHDSLLPLTMLDQLYISYTTVGVEVTLSLLHPFVGRNMTTINFRHINTPTPSIVSDSNIKDGVLDANKTAIIRKICVADFSLTESLLFYVEVDSLTFDVWDKCLENLDLSNNPWKGSRRAFMMLNKLKNLRSLVIKDGKRNCFNNKFPTVFIIPPFQYSSLQKRLYPGSADRQKLQYNFRRSEYDSKEHSNKTKELFYLKQFLKNRNNTLRLNTHNFSVDHSSLILWISKSLKYLDLSMLMNDAHMDNFVTIKGAENVEYINLTDSGLIRFTGKVEGFINVKTLIFSGNDMSTLATTFFDTFTSLETLALASCGFDVNFISTHSTRLLSSLKNLKRLDLSSNSLSILAQDMFQNNTNLTELSLSGNRFSQIPFSMINTPKLTRLDIRYNAITSLQPQITGRLDFLAHEWGEFELYLDGNVLSCACQNIKFLQWLRLTAVTLDRDGNFTCINEQGVLTYTDAYMDLGGFWRQCWGQFFFYVSLILFSFVAIGFLCAFVINKYRTFIVSQLLGIFFGFRHHLPGDYKIGVFFAYEDLDYQFVTGDLKRFVEQRLGISTYIRHRDLDPGVALGEAIAEAIASCWRTVIIINQDFQDSSEYFQFTCRSAVSMINLANPFRVLVLVSERYRHRIPRDILSAIQEDNIVVVDRLEMDGAMQQILINRLTR